MPKYELFCDEIPNLPWQTKPAASDEVIWRYDGNPIITGHVIPGMQAVYNSATAVMNGRFLGVFRVENRTRHSMLHLGRSDDGISWTLDPERLPLDGGYPGCPEIENQIDPRVTQIGEWYYICWCNWIHGPMVGLARTRDFVTFEQYENSFLPFNRNAVLFPRKFGDEYAMLSRPSNLGHTECGDIFLSHSKDLTYWGRHRLLLPRGKYWWDSLKVGAGPVPIETSAGWLVLYHGVLSTCSGSVYSIGTCLLDRDDPSKLLARSKHFALCPEMTYETTGFVPNVCFPTAALCDGATGRLAIYYGAADTHVALAFATTDELIDFTLENNMI